MNTIRVLLCDDHPLVLEGVAAVLRTYDHIEVVAAVPNALQALEIAAAEKPSVVLMDINMAGLNGLDAIELFRERAHTSRLLMLSMHDSREYISTAVMLGAEGYVLKDVRPAELVTAIEQVAAGKKYFSTGVAGVLLRDPGEEKPPLSSREQSILMLVATGHSNKDIAGRLGISVLTVETHRKNIRRKLGVSTTAGLIQYAMRQGIIQRG